LYLTMHYFCILILILTKEEVAISDIKIAK
jgi:hypothetical protein